MGVKLGQKWAVKDGNLLASNQVGSRFFNKEFDFSRASNGTYVDRDGLLKTAELYNLVSYSEDFSQSIWTKASISVLPNVTLSPDGVLNASKIVPNSGTTLRYISHNNFIGTIGQTYTTSFYIKDSNVGEVRIYSKITGSFDTAVINLTTGEILSNTFPATPSVTDVGNGWWKVSYTEVGAGSVNIPIYIQVGDGWVGNGVDGIYIFGAQVVEGTEPLDYQYTNGLQGLPRISFEDGVGHLLLEPQRSNLILKSEPTSAEGVSIGVSYESFDWGIGFNNCVRYPDNSTLYLHYGGTCLASTVYTLSYYIKMDNGQEPIFGTDFSHRIGNVVGTSPTLTNMGNGVYRVSETKTSSTSNLTRTGVIKDTINSAIGFRITALQLEQASYPTSYIKTEGTSVTRLADVCNNSGSAQDFNSEEGVLYAEISTFEETSGGYKYISISDGTYNNRLSILYSIGGTNQIRAFYRVGGVAQCDFFNTIPSSTEFAKIAFKYKENDFALWINGVEAATDSSGSIIPSNTLDNLSFSEIGTGSSAFYGKVRNVQVFTEALSDAELQQLTT